MFRRLWYLIHRRRLERELEEEMAAHRDMLPEADRARFGSALRLREQSRDAWGWFWLDSLLQDLKFGARVLFHRPGFTAAMVAVLSLGMAVALTAFQVFNAQFLRPLPVRDPASLFVLHWRGPESYATGHSFPAFRFVRDHNPVLSAAMVQACPELRLGRRAESRVHASFVSPNYFDELGARPAFGRLFHALKPDYSGPEPVAVLGYAFWQRHFGSDPAVIGRTIFVNKKPAVVIGIAPARFTGLMPGQLDLWLPVSDYPWYYPGSDLLTSPSKRAVAIYARLRPGVSVTAAEDALHPLTGALRREFGPVIGEHEWLHLLPAGYAFRLEDFDHTFWFFAATLTLLVLAIAAANGGTLQVARAVGRRREMWIRASLGAGRFRLLRQLLVEALLVSALAGGLGLLLSYAATALILRTLEISLQVGRDLDWRVALFAAAVTLACTALFGLAPALQLSAHRSAGRRTRAALVAVQAGATCVLLIVAALYLRGLQRVLLTPQGFEFRNAAVIDPALYERGYSETRARLRLAELMRRAAAVPGVRSAALCTIPPLGVRMSRQTIQRPSGDIEADLNHVSASFFATMGISILHGRAFRPGERKVVIVSESIARRVWPGENPVGKMMDGAAVIGVAANARTTQLRDATATEMYFPLEDTPFPESAVILVRTAGPPNGYLPALRAAVEAPNEPPLSLDLLSSMFDRQTAGTRKGLAVIGGVGLLMLLVAAIGIGALLSYAVSQQTREIGIRIALGAPSRRVSGLILGQSAMPVLFGLLCGTAGGFLISAPLQNQLYGLSHMDPPAYVGALLLFLAAAGAAALGPVRRALRIAPASALRHE